MIYRQNLEFEAQSYSHSSATLFCVQELHDDLIVDFYFYEHLTALCLFIFSSYSLNTNSSM